MHIIEDGKLSLLIVEPTVELRLGFRPGKAGPIRPGADVVQIANKVVREKCFFLRKTKEIGQFGQPKNKLA